jgi:hypothetical protein
MCAENGGTVKLKVELDGAIAYVPSGNGYWVLLPNALVPVPAKWGRTNENIFYARAPHISMLLAKKDLLVSGCSTTGLAATAMQKYTTLPSKEAPTIAFLIFGKRLTFHVPEGCVCLTDKVKEYLPRMAEISPAHSEVAPIFNPEDDNFDADGLATAFEMRSGTLDVKSLFGGAQPVKVDFAYPVSVLGKLHILGRCWHREVSNKLTWTVDLPPDCREVKVSAENLSGDGQATDFIFRARPKEYEINVSIIHAEAEAALFFQDDPTLPRKVGKLPDPDFEMFYDLSPDSNESRHLRVPVDIKGGVAAGGIEKPCTGGLFEGFSK